MASEPRVLAGRYELLREIGRGGLGVVWEARDLSLKRDVAVKAILPDVLDRATRARFRREAATQARVRHPHLIQVYDYGEEGDRPYIVMELLEGRDLRELLEEGAIGLEEAVEVVACVASAVQRVHEAGIVHRDIKPENVVIDRTGRPRLGDFGIALDRTIRDRLTAQGSWIGTPAYMSPEQATGDPDIRPPSDVYALGAVLYRIVAGSAPHDGQPIQVLSRIQVGPPPDPADVAEVDPALAGTVRRAMAQDPDDRHPSAGDLAADLEAWLTGTGPAPASQIPWRAVVGGFLVVLILAGAALGLHAWWSERVRRDRARDLVAAARSASDPVAILERLEQASRLAPRIAGEATHLRAEALLELERPGEAEELLDGRLERRPGDALAHRLRARARRVQGDLDGAAEDLRDLLGPSGSVPRAVRTLAEVEMARGEPGAALEALARLEEDAPTPDLLVLRAEARAAAGETEDALADLWRATGRVETPAIDLRVGRLAWELGDEVLALRHLDEAVDAGLGDPSDERALARLRLTRRFAEPTRGGRFAFEGGEVIGSGTGEGHWGLASLLLTEDPGLSYALSAEVRLEGGSRGPYAGFAFGTSGTVHAVYLFADVGEEVRPRDDTAASWSEVLATRRERTGTPAEAFARAAVLAGERSRVLTTRPAGVEATGWIPLRLEIDGSRIRVAVDGRTVIDLDHGHPLEGRCGLLKFYDTRVRWRSVRLEDDPG